MKIKSFLKTIIFTFVLMLGMVLVDGRAFADDTVSVKLDIESATSTIFNGVVDVSACESAASSTPTFSAYCAVLQSGVNSSWSSWGDDKFLDNINGITNDYINNFYWSWFSNFEYGQTSLNKHILSQNENLLITIGRMPLKLEVSTNSPVVGDSLSASVLEFGFDASYNGVWNPSASSSIKIGSELFPADENGHYNISVSSSDPFSILAVKSSFLDSASITITPIVSTATTTATTTATSTPPAEMPNSPVALVGFSSGGGSPQNSDIIEHHNIDINKAFQFLANNQNSDGSFSSSLYTDWAAIAFGAGSQNSNKDKIISYLKSLDGGDLSSATDYERRAMALMSLGINPYSGASINYIQKIVDKFDGNQIGEAGLVNDDIFAILPLIRAGYSEGDEIIKKIISFIISKQNADGSWMGGIDMTSAGIQALSLTPATISVNQAKEKARAYLSVNQKSDGGFGSSFSTSWALQAIAAFGESGENWVKNNNNPYDYIYSLQQNDGGVENASVDANTRIWATAYAIPATLNKPWGDILHSFTKTIASETSQVSGEGNTPNNAPDTSNSSSSLIIATSTINDSASSTTLNRATGAIGLQPDGLAHLRRNYSIIFSPTQTVVSTTTPKPKISLSEKPSSNQVPSPAEHASLSTGRENKINQQVNSPQLASVGSNGKFSRFMSGIGGFLKKVFHFLTK